MTRSIPVLLVTLAIAAPAAAQLPSSLGKMASKAVSTYQDVTFTDTEEQQMGSDISAKLRDKYGVVQDKNLHKYVTLVGSVLAAASSRPNLKWTFIVLDTDGVNAFAAPGGFIHITRGALALIQNESELADVLGHEISHVTLKHTLNAIRKSKIEGLGAQATKSDIISKFVDQGYEILLENGYDRKDETAADESGVKLANGVGYAPTGLSAFLTRLADRNKGLKDPSGLFASHPDTQARLDALQKLIAAAKLTASATVQPRYAQSVPFKPVPVDQVAQTTGGAAPAAAPPASQPKTADSKGSSKGLGLGGMNPLSKEKSSSQTVSSAGSRGVNPDRDAKGGPVKTAVVVSVTQAEIDTFKKGIA